MPLGVVDHRNYTSPPRPADDTSEETLRRRFLLAKEGFFSWKSLGGVFASLLVVGWIFIVVVLIQEEKWQLVLVSWLLLYAAAHFCYWYFRRHNLLPFTSQLCRRRRGVRTSVRPITKPTDLPPSYEEVIKSEHPPPAYCSVAIEGSKSNSPKSHKFSIFSFDSLSTVFGKTTPLGYQTKADRPSSADSMSSVMEVPNYSNQGWSPPPFSISQQLSGSSLSEERDYFPERSLDARNHRSQVSRQASSRSTRSSLIRRESIAVSDAIAPIMAPIYNNVTGYSESPGTVPNIEVCPSPSQQPSTSHSSEVLATNQPQQ